MGKVLTNKNYSVKLEEAVLPDVNNKCRDSTNTKKKVNMTPVKEHNNSLGTHSKEKEIYEMPDKDFKKMIARECS